MKGHKILIGVLTFAALMILAVGLSMAQGPGPEPEDELGAQGIDSIEAVTGRIIPIQGRLTDASGNPISGTKSITFTLYTALSGGTIVCQDKDSVTVNNGLFNASMDYCTASDINGQRLYLGIWVAGEAAEMTPRQVIYPVPYAFSLVPGAVISFTDSTYATLNLYNNGDDNTLYLEGKGAARADATLRVHNTQTNQGMAAYLDNNSQYATAHFANTGVGEVLYLQNNGGPFIKAVNNTESQTMFTVNYTGTVSQQQQADGLVKAAVYAYCSNTNSSIDRSFNNVGGTITIANGASVGRCTIDFGFRIDDRYFVAVPVVEAARGVSCYWGASNTKLDCFRFDAGGAGVNGSIMVTIY